MYSEEQVQKLFADCGAKNVHLERIDRDLFVTAEPAN